MKAILLAAGKGTRLLPLTKKIPKCLVEINGRPLLDIWIKNLLNAGISDILINTHYMSDIVQDYVKKRGYDKYITIFHEKELLGTAGTLLHNYAFVKDGSTFLIHADNLSIFDIQKFVQTHKSRPNICDMSMMVFETDNPRSCGIVEVNKDGIITDFQEKPATPKSSLANGAVYIIEPALVSRYMDRINYINDFSTEIIPNEMGRIFAIKNSDYHRDIGTPESLELANQEYGA